MSKFFTLAHSPLGGDGSFSIGSNGGGVSVGKARLCSNSVYIGYKQGEKLNLLPFYKKEDNPSNSFTSDYSSKNIEKIDFLEEECFRELSPCIDAFVAPKMRMDIITPFNKCKDIADLDEQGLRRLLAPTVLIELSFDNSLGDAPIIGVFALSKIEGHKKLDGIEGFYAYNGHYALGSDCECRSDFDICSFFDGNNKQFSLAPINGFVVNVPSRAKKTMRVVIGFYKDFIATSGTFNYKYFYTSIFKNIEDVILFGYKNFNNSKEIAENTNNLIKAARNNVVDYNIFSHAVHGYFCSTALFGSTKKYLYVVNEGSFRMLNTLDLFIDHIFFESIFFPFAVNNQLQNYYKNYKYVDTINGVKGVSFCHDIGCFNVFEDKGNSSYEIPNQSGCYSFMTTEQLCNFIIAAAINKRNGYSIQYGKRGLLELYKSLLIRDNPAKNKRSGCMNIDSSKCGSGGEITTYDSIDHSLGVSRGNLYINIKRLVSLYCLQTLAEEENYFSGINTEINLILYSVTRCFNVELKKFSANKLLDVNTEILPIIEPLVYLKELNIEIPHDLRRMCQSHIESVLKENVCLFSDGGLKLSASSNNSWQSKCFIILAVCKWLVKDVKTKEILKKAKLAHLNWWENGCKDNCAIDQIFDGTTVEKGFYYPRAVTSILFFNDIIKL